MLDLLKDMHFYFFAIPAVLIYGISKGGFGGVFGVVSVPLLSVIISPHQAAAIFLPLLIAMDIFVLKKFWGVFDKRSLWLLIPSAVLGVVIGYFTVGNFEENHSRLLVGTIAIVFGLQYFLMRDLGEKSIDKKDKLKGFLWGTVAGFTSYHVHAGGPPVSAYLLPKKFPPLIYAGTTGIFFCLVNLIKLPAFIAAGQLTTDSLLLSLVLAPLVPISVNLGHRMVMKFSDDIYYFLISVGLILLGIRLLYTAINLEYYH